MNCGKRGNPPGLVVNCAFAQGVVDDLLHELGQPLTALHCSLELALRKESNAQKLRDAVGQAMVLTERLLKIASSKRTLIEADSAGRVMRMDLSEAVRAIAEDLRPVVESDGKEMWVAAEEAAMIHADPERISRALFAAADLAIYRLKGRRRLLLATYCCEKSAICYIGEDRGPLPGIISSVDLRAFAPGGTSEMVARMAGAAGGSMWELFLQNCYGVTISFPRATA